ncbi:hypothetical protein LEP1GSC088_2344 [Leptospira interrogans str. L1207]|nr:hypothetical protein LEP1GSC088_2344 [Leptospira interrogans str. L1207]
MGSEFYRSIPKMWELPQTTILRTNSKIVGTHTFRKFFLNRTRFLFRQNGAPSGLEKRGLDARHLAQNKKTNRRNAMKRKVYVGMDVHK